MDIGNNDQEYGLFCLNHSRSFNGKTIDKLTFTVPKQYFKKYIFNYPDKVYNRFYYIENRKNQYFKLHIQGEFINPLVPMLDSVIVAFYYIVKSKIFYEEINIRITRILEECNRFNNASILLIKNFKGMDFHFSELELAFDFFNCVPFIDINNQYFRMKKDTYYSTDYKKIYRKGFKDDDSFGYIKDGVRDSIFSIYNRGKKLKIKENVWRVEWRLRDIRSTRLLDMTDLRLNMDEYIYKKCHRLKRIFNYWIPQNSIIFNLDYINRYFPIFSVLTSG